MKKILILLILIFSFINSYSQSTMDSVETVLKEQYDVVIKGSEIKLIISEHNYIEFKVIPNQFFLLKENGYVYYLYNKNGQYKIMNAKFINKLLKTEKKYKLYIDENLIKIKGY